MLGGRHAGRGGLGPPTTHRKEGTTIDVKEREGATAFRSERKVSALGSNGGRYDGGLLIGQNSGSCDRDRPAYRCWSERARRWDEDGIIAPVLEKARQSPIWEEGTAEREFGQG